MTSEMFYKKLRLMNCIQVSSYTYLLEIICTFYINLIRVWCNGGEKCFPVCQNID